jgi:cell division protein FtsQ
MKWISANRWKAIKKVLLLLMWTGMISCVVFVLAFTHKQESSLPCKKVYVAVYPIDIHFYNRQRVLETMRKGLRSDQKLLGMELDEIQVSRLEQELLKQPLLEDAEVYADMHGVLNVRVEQRRPILRVMRFDGTQYYLDQYGVKIPLSENFTCRVPLASGNIFERFEKGDSVYSFVGNQLFKMASYVDKHPFYKALIEQIFVRADNELVLVPKVGSKYIIFGNADEPDKKFRKLLVFYREGLNRIGWNKYRSIDIRFDGQVICKK